jgi:predicted transcriptional regulator YdeE
VPVELLVKVLPPTQYAVFTLHGEEITSDWPRRIYQEWLPGSGYEPTHQYNFQYYDERFKGIDKINESTIDVYVPVKRVDE